jgi:hypothetical protein
MCPRSRAYRSPLAFTITAGEYSEATLPGAVRTSQMPMPCTEGSVFMSSMTNVGGTTPRGTAATGATGATAGAAPSRLGPNAPCVPAMRLQKWLVGLE